jgi:hypothetical protein
LDLIPPAYAYHIDGIIRMSHYPQLQTWVILVSKKDTRIHSIKAIRMIITLLKKELSLSPLYSNFNTGARIFLFTAQVRPDHSMPIPFNASQVTRREI